MCFAPTNLETWLRACKVLQRDLSFIACALLCTMLEDQVFSPAVVYTRSAVSVVVSIRASKHYISEFPR